MVNLNFTGKSLYALIKRRACSDDPCRCDPGVFDTLGVRGIIVPRSIEGAIMSKPLAELYNRFPFLRKDISRSCRYCAEDELVHSYESRFCNEFGRWVDFKTIPVTYGPKDIFQYNMILEGFKKLRYSNNPYGYALGNTRANEIRASYLISVEMFAFGNGTSVSTDRIIEMSHEVFDSSLVDMVLCK